MISSVRAGRELPELVIASAGESSIMTEDTAAGGEAVTLHRPREYKASA